MSHIPNDFQGRSITDAVSDPRKSYTDRLAEDARDFGEIAKACTDCVEELQKINSQFGLAKSLSPIEDQLLKIAEACDRMARQPLPAAFHNLPPAGTA